MSTRALARPILLMAALSSAWLTGCGERSPAGPDETWPLTLSEPGVLGYAAVSLPEAELSSLLEGLLGWAPGGLDANRPFVAVRLESAIFGGPVAVIAPLADGPAFSASLRENPLVEVTGEGHYRVHLSPETGLGMLMLLSSTTDVTSPAGVLAALQEGIDLNFPLQIELQGDVAFVGPSFEALSLGRQLHERLSGPAPAEIVLSVDLQRIQTVYAEDIRALNDQLKALMSGARVGAPLLLGMQSDGGLDLPVNWELLWALYDMFEGRQFAAAQLWLARHPPSSAAPLDSRAVGDADGASDADADSREFADDVLSPLDGLEQVSVRVRFADGSRLRAVVDSLRPAPSLDEARLVLAADPQAFARAFAQWFRPVAAVVKGEGPPCDRYVDELAALLGGWDGRLALVPGSGDTPVLLVAARETDVSLQRWLDWFAPLLATAHVEGLPADARTERLEDGTLVARDAQGELVLRARLDDGVLWVVPGDAADPPLDLLQRFRERQAPATGSALRATVEGYGVQLTGTNGELWAQFTVPADGR